MGPTGPRAAFWEGRRGLLPPAVTAESAAPRRPPRRAPHLHRSRSPVAGRSTPRWRGSTEVRSHLRRAASLLCLAPRPRSTTTAGLLHPIPPPFSLYPSPISAAWRAHPPMGPLLHRSSSSWQWRSTAVRSGERGRHPAGDESRGWWRWDGSRDSREGGGR
jgi:hypothetical protein